jgi:hypothetical protein
MAYINTQADGTGSNRATVGHYSGEQKIADGGALTQYDEGDTEAAVTADQIIFTVPATKSWEIVSAYYKLTSDAGAGNRLITFIYNAALWIPAGATQAATLTYAYNFAPGINFSTAIAGTSNLLTVPIPPKLTLNAAQTLEIVDDNSVGADTIVSCILRVREFTTSA